MNPVGWISNFIGGASDATDAVKRIAEVVFNPNFWKRAGVVFLGSGMLITSLIILFRHQIAGGAKVAGDVARVAAL